MVVVLTQNPQTGGIFDEEPQSAVERLAHESRSTSVRTDSTTGHHCKDKMPQNPTWQEEENIRIQ